MSDQSEYLMVPLIVFKWLTKNGDLVGYLKLVRLCGVPGVWKDGNKSLAKKLDISYGSLVRLKQKLIEVGFIEVTSGDRTNGEADQWHIFDLRERNRIETEPERTRRSLERMGVISA